MSILFGNITTILIIPKLFLKLATFDMDGGDHVYLFDNLMRNILDFIINLMKLFNSYSRSFDRSDQWNEIPGGINTHVGVLIIVILIITLFHLNARV
jgi:hypothetical protein